MERKYSKIKGGWKRISKGIGDREGQGDGTEIQQDEKEMEE